MAPTLAGSTNLAVPLSGPWQYLTTVGSLGLLEVAWFVVLIVVAGLARSGPLHMRLALAGYLLLLVSLSWSVWAGDAAWLRAATESSVLAWLLIFHTGQRRVLGPSCPALHSGLPSLVGQSPPEREPFRTCAR